MIAARVCALVLAAVASTSVAATDRKATVSVADILNADSPTCGIQEAIDALPATGGVVTVPPGTYCIRQAIRLRSHVTLRGAGSTSVLTRGKQVAAKLTKPGRKGETSIEVESTAGFRPGDEVALMANRMHGWYLPHCIVKAVEPTRLTFEQPIRSGHKEGIFRPERKAVAINYFPFIIGHRHCPDKPTVEDVAVLDLTFDSNLKENPGPWGDFTLAAIHFAGVSDSLVRGCIVRGSVGDGIGVQGGHDNRVEGCLVEHCRGHGFHPGTTLRGAVFANNIGRHNGGDGLYFCWQVVGITVTNNLFHGNKASGIGGLGEGGTGGDRFNVVANNVCRHNGRWGIRAFKGHDNVITGNVCLDNSQSKPGLYSGIHVSDTTRTLVSGNRCGADSDKPTQKLGIEECGASDANVITGNQCTGNIAGGIAIVGKTTQASANVGTIVRK